MLVVLGCSLVLVGCTLVSVSTDSIGKVVALVLELLLDGWLIFTLGWKAEIRVLV